MAILVAMKILLYSLEADVLWLVMRVIWAVFRLLNAKMKTRGLRFLYAKVSRRIYENQLERLNKKFSVSKQWMCCTAYDDMIIDKCIRCDKSVSLKRGNYSNLWTPDCGKWWNSVWCDPNPTEWRMSSGLRRRVCKQHILGHVWIGKYMDRYSNVHRWVIYCDCFT